MSNRIGSSTIYTTTLPNNVASCPDKKRTVIQGSKATSADNRALPASY